MLAEACLRPRASVGVCQGGGSLTTEAGVPIPGALRMESMEGHQQLSRSFPNLGALTNSRTSGGSAYFPEAKVEEVLTPF